MNINDFLKIERIIIGGRAANKRQVLELLAELLAKDNTNLNFGKILKGLLERECLGGTSLGNGIAIPHSRINEGEHIIGAFLQLNRGIAFDAIDNEKVDLFFALLIPDQAVQEHLFILSRLARLFNDAKFCHRIRKAYNSASAYELFINEWSNYE